VRTRLLDLPGGLVEQGAALGSVAVEVCERLAVLALKNDRLAVCRRARLEAVEAIVDVGEPVATLGVFAFIDDIDADLALTRDHVGHRLAQRRLVLAARAVGAVGARQAADMGGEDPLPRAASHRRCAIAA